MASYSIFGFYHFINSWLTHTHILDKSKHASNGSAPLYVAHHHHHRYMFVCTCVLRSGRERERVRKRENKNGEKEEKGKPGPCIAAETLPPRGTSPSEDQQQKKPPPPSLQVISLGRASLSLPLLSSSVTSQPLLASTPIVVSPSRS